jgi:SAM-dependent methyltransferase
MNAKTNREREFHDARFSDGIGARPQDGFYRAVRDAQDVFNSEIEACVSAGGYGLEIGCSTGDNLERLLKKHTFDSYGIDISANAVEAARRRLAHFSPSPKIDVMDANKLSYRDESFDFCFGSGVMHHLQLPQAFVEARRVIKTGGKLIFMEPLATNPLIQLYRRMTPADRSADETPLTSAHITAIHSIARDVKMEFFGFFTLAGLALAPCPPFQTRFMRLARWMDRMLFKVPGAWRLAWVVIIKAQR